MSDPAAAGTTGCETRGGRGSALVFAAELWDHQACGLLPASKHLSSALKEGEVFWSELYAVMPP